nr:hypothetical protein [Clostridia bacterium]
ELAERIDGFDEEREKRFAESENCDRETAKLNSCIEEYKGKVEEKEKEIRGINGKIAELDNLLYNMSGQRGTLNAKEEFYRSQKETYAGYLPVIQNLQLRAKKDGSLKSKIKGIVAEIITCDKKYDVALETALGASAQNVVTQTPDDAKYLIEYLKVNGLGRLTFLPITSVKPRNRRPELDMAIREKGALGEATALVEYSKEYSNVISALLEDTLIVEDMNSATLIAKKYSFSFKIVTLDGDVIATQGSMTGGSRKKNNDGVLSNERKLEEVIERLKEIDANTEKIKAERAGFDKKLDVALSELEKLNGKIAEFKQNIVLTEQKKADLEKAIATATREKEACENALRIVKGKIDEINSRLRETSGGAEKLEKDKATLSSEAEKNSLEVDTLTTEKNELVEKQNKLQIGINNLYNVIDSEKANVEKMNSDVENENAYVKEAEAEIEKRRAIIEELRLQQSIMAMTEEERKEIDAVEAEINDIERSSDALKEQIKSLNAEKDRLTEEISVLTDKKHEEEIALTKIDSDLEYLQQSIWEDYGETYESAQKSRVEDYDVKFGESEIARIKHRINFLGNINANAIDDFRALKERYDDMLVQKKDLEDAEADIREALDTIRDEMVKQFDEGFNKINENFGKIFKELFGGGRAMLEL